MQIEHNISLQGYNSFGVAAIARYFSRFPSLAELQEIINHYQPLQTKKQLLILGGGSNILFTQDFDGLVVKNEIKGIELVKEDSHYYYIKAAAGENWHQFVMYCVDNGLGGVENLSLIPGNVGASPMQNIGAYGVEIKDVFYELEAYHLGEQQLTTFKREDCAFGYRESVFKHKYKGQFVITAVTFKLNKQHQPNTSYGAIEQELIKAGVEQPGIRAVADAVMNIRRSKLPDPAQMGNAGSFFKNPVIDAAQFSMIKKTYPEIVGYPAEKGKVKVAAGWLIEQCGWKGFKKGNAGVHTRQALVLVNYGGASGMDIYNLSTEVMHSVEVTFGILLEREVNII